MAVVAIDYIAIQCVRNELLFKSLGQPESFGARMIYGIVGIFGNMLQQQEQIEIKRDIERNRDTEIRR